MDEKVKIFPLEIFFFLFELEYKLVFPSPRNQLFPPPSSQEKKDKHSFFSLNAFFPFFLFDAKKRSFPLPFFFGHGIWGGGSFFIPLREGEGGAKSPFPGEVPPFFPSSRDFYGSPPLVSEGGGEAFPSPTARVAFTGERGGRGESPPPSFRFFSKKKPKEGKGSPFGLFFFSGGSAF